LPRPPPNCTVGPDYARPNLDVPAAWRIDYPKAAEVANAKWWKQFGDPVLNGLIEAALRENRDVRIAAARVDQFAGALVSTRPRSLPRLGYSADVSRAQVSASRRRPSLLAPTTRSRCTRHRWAPPGSSTFSVACVA